MPYTRETQYFVNDGRSLLRRVDGGIDDAWIAAKGQWQPTETIDRWSALGSGDLESIDAAEAQQRWPEAFA